MSRNPIDTNRLANARSHSRMFTVIVHYPNVKHSGTYPPTESEEAYHLMKRLAARGHDVTAFTSANGIDEELDWQAMRALFADWYDTGPDVAIRDESFRLQPPRKEHVPATFANNVRTDGRKPRQGVLFVGRMDLPNQSYLFDAPAGVEMDR